MAQFETWFRSLHPEIPAAGADAVLRLQAEGATIPFIARYRKEQTGGLSDVSIQAVIDAKERWDLLASRKKFVLEEIERQGKLTPELREKLEAAVESHVVEDIYLPYKVKRKTKAQAAREAGLLDLAEWIWGCGHGTEQPQPGQTLELWALTFRNEGKGIKDADGAIQGAQDILVERLSESAELREEVRKRVFAEGNLRTRKADKAKANSKFENYFEYHESVSSLLKPENSHRYLALRRGWMEEELTLAIGAATDKDEAWDAELVRPFETAAWSVPDSPGASVLSRAARLALKAHVLPSIENEVHKALKEVADEAAIRVFAENLRKLLLASPFGSKAVLGVDPGIRTGCKLAVVDDSGKFVADAVMHLQTDDQKEKAKVLIEHAVKTAGIRAIAVGNGTFGREAELFIRGTLKEKSLEVPVVMVSESGASVYSASEAAREEFPSLDVTVRGAISIARRLQDPLAELVKVEPKSIGVGQYQHDVAPGSLKRSLDLVVDSCVNSVGINVNTASYHLLAHVAGIGPALAKGVVEHRSQQGLFKARADLLEVPRFSKSAFEQAAGFLRVPGAENPLDNTGVHPERHAALEAFAKKIGKEPRDLVGAGVELVRKDKELRASLGEFTFEDIVRELEKPGRDPREEFVAFQYRDDIHKIDDLKPGMICPGIVTNVTNFGAFVDIGVHQDGLVHISQLSERYVKDPREVVSPGDRVKVKVLEANVAKSQISLTIKGAAERPAPSPRPEREARGERGGGRGREHGQGHGGGRGHAHGGGHGPGGGHGGGGGRGPGRPQEAPKKRPTPTPAFNNPFGGLASLRGTLPPKQKP
jgi:uncharacterized protein